jgi:hypothetical protein
MIMRSSRCLAVTAATIIGLAAAPASAQDADPSDGPSASEAAEPAIRDLAAGGDGPLRPGRYRDTSTGQALTFDLGEGWSHGGSIPEAGLILVREEAGAPYFAITHFDGTVFNAPCATPENADTFGPDPVAIEATAASFIEHLAAHPFLTVRDVQPVELASAVGVQADIDVSVPGECDPPWAWLWAQPTVGDYHLTDGQLVRVVALDVDDEVIVAVMELFPDGDFPAFVEAATGVLESMEVGEPG